MRVTCANCSSIYQVAVEKVPPSGARSRCPECGHTIPIPAPPVSGTVPLTGSAHPDYGRTIAYDYASVDQSLTDASVLLRQVSSESPYLKGGRSYHLQDVGSGQIYAINRPEVVVGRSGAEVNLTDPEVSRRHCMLRIYGNHAILSDLESTNGTYFEGRKVMTAKVPSGGHFSVGNTSLMFIAEPSS